MVSTKFTAPLKNEIHEKKIFIKKAKVPVKEDPFNKKNELRSCQKCVLKKFRKIHRKTPVLDSFF